MVAKRGGDLEPFDAAKPRRCLAAVMRTCDLDARFADALAQAVDCHVRDWPEESWPTTDYVFRCLRSALTQTGMQQAADELCSHRRRRAAQRRAVSVCMARQGRDSLAPWRKATVARKLERRNGLSHSVARILAGEIEQRVLGLGYTVVSAALIAELVRNELQAWGLAHEAAVLAPEVRGTGVLADRQPDKEP